jgi:hypothetical protein
MGDGGGGGGGGGGGYFSFSLYYTSKALSTETEWRVIREKMKGGYEGAHFEYSDLGLTFWSPIFLETGWIF